MVIRNHYECPAIKVADRSNLIIIFPTSNYPRKMQSPCAFEVQLPRRELAPTPAIKQRLEQSGSRRTITMDDINTKMSKAAKNRELALAKQISDVKENLDKVCLVRERRNSEERMTASRISERIAAAEEKRQVQISSI